MKPDIRWAAGLFEGEGCCTMDAPGTGKEDFRLTVASSDNDVIRMFKKVAGCGKIYGPYPPRKRGTKHMTWFVVTGVKAIALAERMRPWLGRRRRDRIAQNARRWWARHKG